MSKKSSKQAKLRIIGAKEYAELKRFKRKKLAGTAWQPKSLLYLPNQDNAKKLLSYARDAKEWGNMKLAYKVGNLEYYEAMERTKVINSTLINNLAAVKGFFLSLEESMQKRNRLSKDECDTIRKGVHTILTKFYNEKRGK